MAVFCEVGDLVTRLAERHVQLHARVAWVGESLFQGLLRVCLAGRRIGGRPQVLRVGGLDRRQDM